MGITYAKLKIKNPKDERRFFEEDFLVDSGAQYTVLPEKYWQQIKLKSQRTQEFMLADGKKVARKIGTAMIEFKNKKGSSPVILGKKNDVLLLGAITLESLGLSINPFQRKIYETKPLLAFTTSTT